MLKKITCPSCKGSFSVDLDAYENKPCPCPLCGKLLRLRRTEKDENDIWLDAEMEEEDEDEDFLSFADY